MVILRTVVSVLFSHDDVVKCAIYTQRHDVFHKNYDFQVKLANYFKPI